MTIHFTSIALLRASHAQQHRVTTVESAIKKINPGWQSEWYFPLPVIGLNNAQADVGWVDYNSSVHASPSKKILLGTVNTTVGHIQKELDKTVVFDADDSSKAKCEAALLQIDAVLTAIAGTPVKWSDSPNIAAGATTATVEETSSPKAQPAKARATKEVKVDKVSTASTQSRAKSSTSPKAGTPSVPAPSKAKPMTKLDQCKALFLDMTPKQKAEMSIFAREKVDASPACQTELNKLAAIPA